MSFASPQIATGFAAGGDLAGTYPSPTLAPAADYEKSSVYHRLWGGVGTRSALAANTLFLAPTGAILSTATTGGQCVFYLDPADYPAGTKTLQLRVTLLLLVNSAAPGAGDWTIGLYPATLPTGAAGTISFTPGTVLAGSTATITSPAANSSNYVASAPFAFPSVGLYSLGVAFAAAMGANCTMDLLGFLERRAV